MISRVFMICDAYEAGYGKGLDKRECGNPFLEGTDTKEAWTIGYTLGYKRALESERTKQIAAAEGQISDKGYEESTHEKQQKFAIRRQDPCPGCSPGEVCRTPACGRLKLPLDHPLRTVSYWKDDKTIDLGKYAGTYGGYTK